MNKYRTLSIAILLSVNRLSLFQVEQTDKLYFERKMAVVMKMDSRHCWELDGSKPYRKATAPW